MTVCDTEDQYTNDFSCLNINKSVIYQLGSDTMAFGKGLLSGRSSLLLFNIAEKKLRGGAEVQICNNVPIVGEHAHHNEKAYGTYEKAL